MAALLVIAGILLLFVIVPSSSTTREDSIEPPATLMDKPQHQPWEKDHFINKHLHRDDKKHDRHKRNQFPL